MIPDKNTTAEELNAYLATLPRDAKVNWVPPNENPPVIAGEHEMLRIGKWIIKVVRNLGGAIIAIWVAAITLAPEWVPTAPQVYKEVVYNAPKIIASIDFSFKGPKPDEAKPWVVFPDFLPNGQTYQGATYFVPVTGLSPEALASDSATMGVAFISGSVNSASV